MKFEDRIHAIARCPLFHRLDEDTREHLARYASSHIYEADRMIFQQGEPGGSLFLITWGAVRRSISTALGREFMLDVVGQDDLLGLLSFLDGSPYETACITLHRTQVLRINSSAMSPAFRTSIESCFTSALYAQLRMTTTLLGDMTMYPLEMRLARLLLRFDRRAQVRPVISSDKLHQGLLALMANATRPKVNKQLQQFGTLGAIRLEAGAVFITEAKILEKIAAKQN